MGITVPATGSGQQVAGGLLEAPQHRFCSEGLEIHHDAANRASRRVPEKLGFTLVADNLPSTDAGSPGEVGIDCIWRITRENWPCT